MFRYGSWSLSTVKNHGSKALTETVAAMEPGSLSTSVCVTRTDMVYLELLDRSQSDQVRLLTMPDRFYHVCVRRTQGPAPVDAVCVEFITICAEKYKYACVPPRTKV